MPFVYLCLFFLLAGPLPCFAIATVSPFDQSAPIEITADSASLDRDKQTSHFTGHVIVVQGPLTLKADHMVVHYLNDTRAKNASMHIDKIEVKGHVVIEKGEHVGKGDEGVYDARAHTLVLEGHVALKENGSLLKGDRLTYNVLNDTTQVVSYQTPKGKTGKGRVKLLFNPAPDPGGP